MKQNPLLIFLNNIRYLFCYNIKDIVKTVEQQKKSMAFDIATITDIAMYKTKVNWDNIKLPKIKNTWETIEELSKTNKSIIRFGDGEFSIMDGISIPFQEYSVELATKLIEIFKSNEENLLIGAPYEFYNINQNIFDGCKHFDYSWAQDGWHEKCAKYYNMNKTYYSAFLALRGLYKNYDFAKHYSTLKTIWANKNITVISGDRVFKNIDFNILENAKTITYIKAPTINAYSEYKQILEKLKNLDKSNILIFVLGPCGKILAYDMFKLGYRVLDLGHLIKDYDFYKKSFKMNEEEFEQFRKDFCKPD